MARETKLKKQAVANEEFARSTHIFRNSNLYKLRYIALVDQTTQTEILDKLLLEYIEKWERKNGPIPMK